jgi:hypothetical protein
LWELIPPASQIFICSASPAGCSKPIVLESGGLSPISIAVGDLNHDGITDLVVANNGDDTGKGANVAVLLGKGHGGFEKPVKYPAGVGPSNLVLGDFNHDGNLDAAVTGFGGNVRILLGKGDGTFLPFKRYPDAGGGSIVAADFNGDGNLDLAVLSSIGSSGAVAVLLGNGDGTFQPPVKFKAGEGVAQVIVADFNHDGKPDLATINNAGSRFSVLLNTTHFPQDAH